jgi:hypothetical protein
MRDHFIHRSRRTGGVLALVVLCAIGASPSLAQELVINGGFETGDLTGWSASPNVYVTCNGFSHSGSCNAVLKETVSLSQTIATTPGASYSLDFWYDDVVGPSSLSVSWDGSVVFQETNTSQGFYSEANLPSLAATGTFTTLQFDHSGTGSGLNLDDVSVVENVSVVSIIIRPGAPQPARIHLSHNGTYKVAILSSADFDAPAAVDTSSLTFGETGSEQSLANCLTRTADVNNDGYPDLVCKFNVPQMGFKLGDTTGTLEGRLASGPAIAGSAAVIIRN